ncbi:MAG: TRAP transporter small permease [Planctomycetes bacterium]|nr:TRAP transporter small permease [Planctomycetota bacterium]
MKQAARAFSAVEAGIIIFLLSFMTVMNFANVVSRYLFASSISAAEELTLMAFIWVSMFGIAAAYRRGAHLGMGLIAEYLPSRHYAWFSLFSTACSLGLIGVLFFYGLRLIEDQIALKATTPALALPAWLESAAIPVGCVFMIIRILQFGIGEFRRLRAAPHGEV